MAYKRSRKDFEADLQKHESPFVLYGTPLPPLDEHSRDDGSYVPVWKQEVTDDRGRKRLHGAFTGGFSAGYFNTVGSKEGWAPSTFVSSRTNRAKNVQSNNQQRPEDFMDEEDIREQDESRQISATEGFAGFGTADDANHKNTLMDLFRPVDDTMGAKLLNRMGWKQGHGIGPKVNRKIESEDDSGQMHLFAPDDVPMLEFVKKSDHKGLGYTGEGSPAAISSQPTRSQRIPSQTQSDEDDEERPGLKFASRKKASSKTKKGAFGVGILNDTGSDDEDPYSMGPKISYNKTLGGDKKSKKIKTISNSNANPLLKSTPIFISKKLSSISNTLRKCHDGRLPLNGFVLADELDNFSTMSLNDELYKPPKVPDGWKPSRMSSLDMTSESDPNTYQSTAEAAKSSTHTSSTRANLLGESTLAGKSIFDYLTPAARENLIKLTGKTNLPPALGQSLPGSTPTPSESPSTSIPSIDPQTALQALSRIINGGFTPYSNDTAKAARYKTYLESQANITSQSTPSPSAPAPAPAPRPQSMSQDEYKTELNEFARTAEVFKPVSGLIASRFTTSSTSSTNLAQSQSTSDPSTADLLTRPAERPRDPAEEAARVGMFGPLTRSVGSFYPSRLLCKRFGVPMPTHTHTDLARDGDVGGHGTGVGVSMGAGVSAGRFQSAGFQREDKDDMNVQGIPGTARSNEGGVQLAIEAGNDTVMESSTLQETNVDPDRNEALEQERPGAAVFKAIFGSDDEDED